MILFELSFKRWVEVKLVNGGRKVENIKEEEIVCVKGMKLKGLGDIWRSEDRFGWLEYRERKLEG